MSSYTETGVCAVWGVVVCVGVCFVPVDVGEVVYCGGGLGLLGVCRCSWCLVVVMVVLFVWCCSIGGLCGWCFAVVVPAAP